MADYRTDEHGNRILVKVYPKDLVNGFFKVPGDVTVIGRYAFRDCRRLTSVVIPDSVTTIEWSAFSCCRGLTSVVIPNSVMTIEGMAFDYCTGLTSVVIPDSVTTIRSSAFSGCSNLQVIAIDAVGDKFERVKGLGLLPGFLRSRVIPTHEYNQIKSVQAEVVEPVYADFKNTVYADFQEATKLPSDIESICLSDYLMYAKENMEEAIKRVPLPNPNEEGWRESYRKMLSEALSNTESLFAALAPAEERETKRQSPAVAISSVGLFSPGAVGDVLEEPSPRPAY